MKAQTSSLCDQGGFTLVESLVALLLFTIIILGSGVAVGRMMNVQKDMHVDFVVTNLMQTRLQNALSTNNDVCSTVDKSTFRFGQTDYHLACATEMIQVDASSIAWPVLAASSTDVNTARDCASGTQFDSSCYIVGR